MSRVSEIESLRSQVAELARELAERDQLLREQHLHQDGELQDLRKQSHQLRAIVTGTAEMTGDDFFPALVTNLTSVLGVQYAVIGKVQQDSGTKKIRTVAVAAGGTLIDNFEYDLLATPCEMALASSFACFEQGVQASFPLFTKLCQLNVESYCGVSIRAKSGAVVGLLIVMDVKPIDDRECLRSLLTMFASRTAAEWEREQAERERNRALADLNNVMETIPDVLFTLDLQGHLVRWNHTLERVTGYNSNELLNKHALEFVPPAEHEPTASAIQRAFQNGYAELEGHMLTKDGRTIPYHWTGATLTDQQGHVMGLTGVGRDITERKRAELALRESSKRFNFAVDATNDGLWDWDLQTGTVFYSPQWMRLLGYSSDEVPPSTEFFFAILHPDDRAQTSQVLQEHLDGLIPVKQLEIRLCQKSGEYRWYLDRGKVVIRDETGRPLRMVGTITDITHRKQAEEKLRSSQDQLRQTLHASNTGLWDWNTETNEATLSREWKAQLGYDEHELPNHFETWKSRLHPDDRDRAVAYVQSYLAQPIGEYHQEFRLKHKDGGYRWIEARASLVSGSHGRRVRLLGSHTDITSRKQMEADLAEREERLRLFVEHSPVALAMFDRDMKYLAVSRRWQSDYDDESLIGRSHYEICPEIPERWKAIYQRCLAGAIERCEEDAFVHADGYTEWTRWEVRPWQRADESVGGIVIFAEDITSRKQTEELLRASEQKLRQALLASNTGLWEWNTETNEVWLSREWKEQIGYKETELPDTFKTWESRLHPDDRAQAVAYAMRYREIPAGAFRQEFRLQHRDGTYRWIEASASFITEPDGRRVRLLGSHTDITDRKQSEDELKLFQTLLDQVTDSIEVIDPSTGHFLDGNRQSHESIGYTRSELLDLTVPDIDPLVTKQVFQERMQQLREVATPLRVESRHLRKDGTTFPVEMVAQILNREREYLVAVVRDISARKELEAERARQYEALQAIFNMTVALSRASSLEEIYEQGINGVQGALKVNRASILLFDDDDVMRFKASRGLSKEYIRAVEGHSPWSRGAVNPPPICMHDIEEDPSVEAYRGIFRAEHIRALGFIPLWSSDGLLGKFMLYYESPHQFTAEEIQVAQTIASHITFMIQRKQAEEALRVSEERYARATAIGKVGVWQLDVASGQYHGDANLKALFGYGPGELSTDPYVWLGLVHPDDQSIALKTWEQIVSGATDKYHYELRMIRKDGSTIWTQVRGHAHRDDTGRVVRLIGATVDITDRKRADEMLLLTQFSVDRAVEGVFWVAPDGRILHVNDATCRMLEYTRDELTAMTIHDIDPNFPPEVWATHWDELKQRGSMTFESKHWSKTGRVFETEVTVNYLQYEGREYNCAILRDIGERKRAEEALAQSEQAIRELHEATAVSGLSFDERVRRVLDVGCRRFNLPIGMLTRKVGNQLEIVHIVAPGTDFTAGMAVPLEQTYCQTTLQETEPVYFEHAGASDWRNHPGYKALGLESYIGTKLIGRDQIYGTICFAGQHSLPDSFSQADQDFVQLMARWISGEMDRRLAEQALKHSEERYRTLYDETPTMYFTLAIDGTVRSVNRYGAEQLGYQAEELVGLSVLGLFHEADKETVASSLSECLAAPETTKQWEFRKVRKDGTVIWVRETARAGQSSTGETVVLVTCEDITERKRAEEALRLSEERFRAVFENAAVGIAVGSHTTGTGIDQVNPLFATMMGYTPEELRHLGMKGITFPDDLPASREFVRQLIGGTISHGAIEKRYVKKDGSLLWAQTTVSSVFDKHGHYLKSIALIQDITDRKRMEEALHQRERDLRAAVEERERISEDLHDGILQSIYAIGLGLEACKPLISEQPKKSAVKLKAEIQRTIGQLNHVLEEVRNFIAGLESHILDGQEFDVVLRTMVQTLAASYAIPARVTVEKAAAQHLSTEQAYHVVHIAREALSNSLRHSHASRTTLSLKYLRRSVRLSVTDNGVGFDPSTTDGTGHGLSNMASRAKKIGGNFTLRSKLQGGTTVILDLPRRCTDSCN